MNLQKSTTSPPRSPVLPGTVFELTHDFGAWSEDLKLRNIEWGILFAVTGEHTVAQIGDHFGLSSEERDGAFSRLVAKGLIAERELTRAEYLRAAATIRDGAPKTLTGFLRSAAIPSAPPVANPVPKGAAARPPSSPGTLERDHENQTRAVPTVSAEAMPFEPLPDPEPVLKAAPPPPAPPPRAPQSSAPQSSAPRSSAPRSSAPRSLAPRSPSPPATPPPSHGSAPLTAPPLAGPGRQLSLKAVIRSIVGRAPDRNVGQLDVYRVFIRVDTKLLKRSGITTLRFEEDRLVRDPDLQRAILGSVERTLGFRCPQEVFVG